MDENEIGFDVRHLVVTTDNIETLLDWQVRAGAFTIADARLAGYLRERQAAKS